MKYKIEKFKIDIGETAIENLFISQYLPVCGHNELKVYLYAYKFAYDSNYSENISDKDLAKALNMTIDEVKKAWDFWLHEGVVAYENTQGEPTIIFKSIRQLYFGISEPFEYVEKIKTYQPVNSNEIREMNNAIEQIMGIELMPNEMTKIQDHIDVTGQTPELIVMGFNFCATQQGKKNLNYVLQVLRNWYLDGITTVDELEEVQKKSDKRKRNFAKKRKYFKPEPKQDQKQEDTDDLLLKKMMEKYRK